MGRAAPRGRQTPEVWRFNGGNQMPRHTETPTPEGVGGTKPSSEISGTMLRTGGRLGVGSKSRIIHRQSAASNPVTPTPKSRMASGGSRPEPNGAGRNPTQNSGESARA